MTSFSSFGFSANKVGYKKYLKSLGIDNYDGVNTPWGAISFEKFKYNCVDERTHVNEELERVNECWLNATLENRTEDEYHCKMNARRLVRRLEEIDK